ncbi:DNA-directed RNA polymerase subunit beta (chloroplast) [Aureococcus anophagefferens]|uniref:DNA-directed RNA polymerase subunit beta n=2 Tax=Aureococcus anophagefferens TaxID=44056 RepID=A0ABR1G543_AURAN|nr:DNA-directed RNA polymerase beta chain [Aureococcus anophagefferens]ACS36793.1 DNA-directed RNA polymerase beta chain [Aureococcus anophagefferens]KAH8042964.1 DNA-directed RNA polymerase subunit beta [Aureococcus anophagefferens]KAH8043063.1 DNA-directed RNA polymerase subunit beta [Aureococcus anophagefferens]KAH8043266.1 DNA-directed RNA polymerase subunit beta [Aureococcus anophagefferens]
MDKQLFVTTIPHFAEANLNSFCWFLESGLSDELRNFSSALNLNQKLNIKIYSDEFILKRPKYSAVQCKRYDLTYAIRLYVPIELIEEDSVNECLAFFGEIPLMTEEGTFIINGCERVIINQIIRSPGIYYRREAQEKTLQYSATLISDRGSWLKFEFETGTVQIRLNKTTTVDFYQLLETCGLVGDAYADATFNLSPLNKPIQQKSLNESKLTQDLSTILNSAAKTEITSDSSFLQIFNEKIYSLGKIGRKKLNSKLGLSISDSVTRVTIEDVIAISNYLVNLHGNNGELDDIDNLRNRRVRSIGELLQIQFGIGLSRLERSINERLVIANPQTFKPATIINPKPIIASIKEFFGSSQLSQFMDQTNPIASLTHKRRISSLGPGGLNRDRLSLAVRDIHPSHYGRICPIETPEGQNAGIIASLSCYARINESGFLETPFFKVKNGKVQNDELPTYLTTEEEELILTAPADRVLNENSTSFKQQLVPVRYKNEFSLVPINQVKLVSVSPLQNFSIATALIPFLEHDDANRALMGSNMQRQSVPLLYPHKPIVGTGLEHQLAADSGAVVISKFAGDVKYVSSRLISIRTNENDVINYKLQKYVRSNQDTCVNQRPIVWPSEKVESGQVIADGPGTNGGELALGQNLLVAYMPWEGYNYEDAILVNERLVQEDLFTSIHIEKFDMEVRQTSFGVEKITRDLPNITDDIISNLDRNGIICKGTFVKSGDILIGKVTPKDETDQLPEGRLLRAIFGEKSKNVSDTSLRVPKGTSGRVINVRVFRRTKGYDLADGSISLVRIFIAQIRKIQVGDKIAGRHGNKGIVSRILPQQDMPFLPNGVPVDILLNPLGVPSRMNVGQIFECLLGLAGSKLNRRFKVMPFDEMYGVETSRNLVNRYLNMAAAKSQEPWVFNSYLPGRVALRDGRTGQLFDNPVLVGKTYMLKLIHQVDDKMHARSTGPYSLITQQPLGGKSRHGGQRFGEMEVWALQAFGCAYTLQELLTLKSDDMEGRNEVLNAIVKGLPIPRPGIPESFKVLIRELHSLGLDISLYKMDKASRGQTNETEVDLLRDYEKNLKRSLPLYTTL